MDMRESPCETSGIGAIFHPSLLFSRPFWACNISDGDSIGMRTKVLGNGVSVESPGFSSSSAELGFGNFTGIKLVL